MKEKEKNEVFALHLNGKLISQNVWKDFSKNYGSNELQGWKPPKRLYYKLGHAKNGIRHLPKQIQNKVEIVKYVPEGENK